jgi:hypothetical protein
MIIGKIMMRINISMNARWWAEARQCEEHQGGREWVHAGDRSEKCVPTESGRHRSGVVAWDGVVVG